MTLPVTFDAFALRRFQAKDVTALQAYRGDPEVARYQSWSAMSDAEAARFITYLGQAPVLKPGAWYQLAIADTQDHLVGDIGVHLEEKTSAVEIGITLARDVWGQGLGVKAYRAAMALVFADARVTQVIGAADARNIASLKMLDRAGLIFDRAEQNTYDGELCTDHVYTLSRKAYQLRAANPLG